VISPNKKPPEIETKTLRLADFSMGLNTTISGSLLNNNELQVAEDVSFEQKGTIMPRRGRRKRYEEAFSDSPCCGLGSYYKKDGTTKLLFAAGDKLYSDSPSISIKWDNQNDWEETNSKQANLDSSTTPGDIQIKEYTQTVPTFTRDSVAYLSDGTEVASGQPRFEDGKFGKGILIEEGTTNLVSNPDFEVDTAGWVTWQTSIERVTAEKWSGNASLKVTLKGTGGAAQTDIALSSPVAGTIYTGSFYVKGAPGKFVNMILRLSGGASATSDLYSPAITCDGTWQRIIFSRAIDYSDRTMITLAFFSDGNAVGDIYYVDGFQLEQKPYATSFIRGSCIPPMTADNIPAPYAVSTSFDQLPGNSAYAAFNGSPDTDIWSHSTFGVTTGQFNIDLGSAQIVNRYEMRCQLGYVSRAPKNWTFEGSNDNANWTVLHTVTNYSDWQTGISSFWNCSNNVAYRYYRINVTANNGDSYLTLAKIQVYYQRLNEVLEVPANVLNKGNWTINLKYKAHQGIDDTWYRVLWNCYIDYGNWYQVSFTNSTGKLLLRVFFDGNDAVVESDVILSAGTTYDITATGDGENLKLYVDGVQVGLTTPYAEPVGNLPDYMHIGGQPAHYANGIIDEFRIDKIARTDAEIADWYNANAPSTPDEYTTYLSHFDGSLSSEKLPHAYWESAPKDVSQASNKASGKAVITQTLNNGQVALYSASSPTSSGTYSDWALALPDGTLQHPPDNFVKTKLKLTDTDPYTVLLMHMDGSDNGTTFTDECGKTVTVHGDVCTKTGISKFGTASAYFNNNGDYLSLEDSEDFNFGSGDFTIDFWIYPTSDITNTDIFSNYWTNGNYSLIIWGNEFYCSSNGSTWDVCNAASLGTIPLNEWTHIAIVRYGTSLKVYVNGTAVVSIITTASIHNSTEPILIGGSPSQNDTMTGYIDEFRISKGVARWTSDFTPPTSQYVLNSRPVVHSLAVTFDGASSATPILDDMSFGAEYMFTTLKDILVIANGQNAPYKWDGIGTPTLLGGSPPVLDFITTHNNRVWGVDAADKSRVRFSDILDPETWSVLNFIDFNPDDGDYITAMVRIGQDLVVSKQWSMALLTGNATTNYSVVWLDAEQGVTGKRALCNTNKYFTYVAQDGIRFTDFNTHAVASERLLPDWEKINKRRLNQAAMIYWRNYLLVSLPRDNSLYNNTVWAYDMLRNAWSIINGWNVSNWLIFKQYGEEVLLAADSTTGQIYEVMRYSRYDDTEPVAYSVRTKDFTFNAPERYKLFRNINLDLEATTVESPLTVDLIVDGEKVGEYSTIVPADDQAKIHRMILPPLYNAVIGRSLSLALRGRCGIQGIALTYSFGGIVPDEEV
jgi:hypothetical protein